MSTLAPADAIRNNNQFWYVYILKLSNNRFYYGYTQNIDERIFRHQNGMVPFTKPFRPVELVFYCAFRDKYLAISFEKYLKSGSGRAFAQKRFLRIH